MHRSVLLVPMPQDVTQTAINQQATILAALTTAVTLSSNATNLSLKMVNR